MNDKSTESHSVLPRIIDLKAMPVTALKKLWADIFAEDPPRFNRTFLEKRLAYRLQELAYGGLKSATIKRLEILGEQLDGGKKKTRSKRADDRPVAGTTLIREWQGTTYQVIVQPDHFEFGGKRYHSLSAIAKTITGTIWNGWLFFGLRARRTT